MHLLNAKTGPVEILLVEDNPGDVILTKKAFERSSIVSNISVAKDGEIALMMLNNESEYENLPTPDIILLDLNIPKKDGKEVLKTIKESIELRKIPVIILSSSSAEQDLTDTYNGHANSYVLKPSNFEKFIEVVKAIESFWFSVTVFPDNF
jgi:CheY-like chemotaxis protein